MKRLRIVMSTVFVVLVFGFGAIAEDIRLRTPYDNLYEGTEATGDSVIALWAFDGDIPLTDASGNGHDGTMKGGTLTDQGHYGGGLVSGRGWPDIDEPHQMMVKNSPALTPKAAFTIEMWIQPNAEMTDYKNNPTLMDKKYVADTDYQFYLGREIKPDTRCLEMLLGFGEDSQRYNSEYVIFPPGVWRHVAFVYDGMGKGSFFVDGVCVGAQTFPSRRGIASGTHNLSVGDRIGSNYRGFPGTIDQVRISSEALEFRSLAIEMTGTRQVFRRMEENAAFQIRVTNLQDKAINGATLNVLRDTTVVKQLELPEIATGEYHDLAYEFDTTLRPDTYALSASIYIRGDTPVEIKEVFPAVVIKPRPLPNTMPVVLWGNAMKELDVAHDLGFTHCLGLRCDYNAVWKDGASATTGSAEDVDKIIQSLDDALLHDMQIVASLSPGRWARNKEDYQRVNRDGKPYDEADVCGLFPRVQQFCEEVGVTMANAYGAHPAFNGVLIHTEVRGQSNLCFHNHDCAAFKEFSGYDIPEKAKIMRGVYRDIIPDFPESDVIPDDYPLYVYYRWIWKQGDGWNTLHTRLHNGLNSGVKDDFWTFHDPAARCASVFGSGGMVDYLSHWTYSYPDPIRIGLCTDELFCMAAGSERKDQQVMKMTQIIWYRSQTAPEPGEKAQQATADFIDKDTRPEEGNEDISIPYQAEWERRIPDARFITIAPMHLREAFWTKIARPIQGIMYHGWGSLTDTASHGSYRYTHPDTKNELKRLVEDIVVPLGPTLRQIPDRPADVAMLESFASEMFAGRGTYGWNGSWAGDMYLILLYAGLQPEILFEESIQQSGLDKYKILVMPDCDVLPESVVTAVHAFQEAGGIVVGDERLCKAITPAISVQTHNRPKEADVARQLNQEKAAILREQLSPQYQWYAGASTSDVIPRVRTYKTTDYLFAVNDQREFGDYAGHHGLVMENGLPADAVLSVARKGYVYDLLHGQQVETQESDGELRIDWHFGPCDGALFMITENPINDIVIDTVDEVALGDTVTIAIKVCDNSGNALDAIVPVEVAIKDPAGRPAEGSGYYGAANGVVSIDFQVASNDCPGLWEITAQELASGCRKNAYFRVK